MPYAIRFGKNGWYHSTFGTRKTAKEYQKKVGGRVVSITKKQWNKVYGKGDWGY